MSRNGPAGQGRNGCWRRACRWNVGVLPRTRRRRICDSRNLSSPSVAAGQPLSVKLHGSCTREDGLDRTRPSLGSAAIGFGGGVWAGQGAVPSPVEGPMSVTRTRASRCRAPCAAGSHAGSHADERPSSSSDLQEQRARTRPRSRTDLNGSGSPYGSYKPGSPDPSNQHRHDDASNLRTRCPTRPARN